MLGGFPRVREQQEVAHDEYEDTLLKCSLGQHPEHCVSFEWSYEGSLDVPNGTRDFKVYHCSFCYQEWT